MKNISGQREEFVQGEGEFNLWKEYRRVVIAALKKHSNDLGKACLEMGISTRTWARYIKLFDIEDSFTNYWEYYRLKKLCKKHSLEIKETLEGVQIPSLSVNILKIKHKYEITTDPKLGKITFIELTAYITNKLQTHENH